VRQVGEEEQRPADAGREAKLAATRQAIEEGVAGAIHDLSDLPVAFVLVTWHETGRTGCSYSTFPKLVPEQALVDQVAAVLVERIALGRLEAIFASGPGGTG
jgi:hypothetical protein